MSFPPAQQPAPAYGARVHGGPSGGPSGGQGWGAPAGYRPPVPARPAVPHRPSITKVFVWVLVVTLIVVSALLTVLAIATSTGVVGLLVGLVLAVLPVFPLVAALLWLDRYEAEPPSMLLFAFAWGASVAALVSIVLNSSSAIVLQESGGDPTLAVWVVAPLVEESAKGLGIVAVLLLRRKEFDGVVDGIVYAGMVAVGFAFVENVLYFGRAFLESGAAGAGLTFVLRGLFSPFAHPLFTMATGIGIGVAVSRSHPAARVLAPVLGWTVAVVLHAAWNLGSLASFRGFVLFYVLVQVPVFAGAVVVAVLARRREGRLIRVHLDLYARSGWLTPQEVRMLGSLPERRQAEDWATRTGGPPGGRAMRDFQQLSTELAFLRERMVRGTAAQDALRTEHVLLHTIWHLRARFLPRR